MIWFGHYNRRLREDEGTFHCPSCTTSAHFAVYRTYQYFHVYFVPLIRQRTIAECVQCDHCKTRHPIAVLGRDAPLVGSAYESGSAAGSSVAENLGNVVVLSEAAANEITRLRKTARYGGDVVTRITPDNSHPNRVIVQFDYALADGSDWIGQSRSIPIVVDRRDAPELYGCTVDFRDVNFSRSA